MKARPAWATALDLQPHPEGGWYRETWCTAGEFQPIGYPGPRPSATGIYYLLGPGERSVWHQVRSDELWLYHRGVALILTIGGAGDEPGEDVEELILGPEFETGQRPQLLVPAGRWQSARPAEEGSVLVSCVVSPGFDYRDWRWLPGA